MTPRTQLQSITLGGFKAIRQTHTLPISKLTLLFGPNSAGKSSLEEAIECLKQIFNEACKEAGKDSLLYKSSFDVLQDAWHRPNGSTNNESQQMKLGVHYLLNWVATADDNFLASEIIIEPDKLLDIEITGNFDLWDRENEASYAWPRSSGYLVEPATDDASHNCVKSQFTVTIDQILLLDIKDTRYVRINLNHPRIRIKSDDAFNSFITTSDGKLGELNDGFLYVNMKGWFFLKPNFNIDADSFIRGNDLLDENYNVLPHVPVRSIESFFNQISFIFRTLILLINLDFQKISASRTVPTEDELTIYTEGNFTENIFSNIISKNSNFPYESIAYSARYKITGEAKRNDDNLLDDMNAILSNHLFIEKGYRLAYEYAVLLSQNHIDDELSGNQIYVGLSDDQPVFIKIFLADADNRKLRFDQVGSGISYVIPVAYALARDGNAFIQQPELHLHPALQANLADAIIQSLHRMDSYSNYADFHAVTPSVELEFQSFSMISPTQLIIETHSEHLLLRLLKRIRQTSSGLPMEGEQKLTPNDLCILYFNPHLNGETSIHQIRVSAEGDFLDRWPHGFFPERDQELFDE
ncbi:AAA family ATPase [Eoetvoesiella caeni]|uniref:AAA ATPase-like protein n=1 Tax=Eoetvoesiella caeni TaxID=645616 RepID=A0A366HF09_9BURK|nr:AAA family ATPase [Eoetvoesiella caeni]MCI2809088.1 AAA family ATPase [Eoetvoesiella caeni]NYT55411.1 AAA family ATPase [Eoetvoesiella caeni]RBP39965.1 AAA ATPase-like protein [Eoetvoesiella caeni]